MTIVVKRPTLRLTRVRVLSIVLIIVTILAVAVPVTLYWAMQRIDTHSRWNTEINYASQFSFQMDYAVFLINATYFKWNNATSSFAGNQMGYADENLNYLSGLDTAHGTQLDQIIYAIESVQGPFNSIPFTNISYPQRAALSLQLHTIAHDILYAYGSLLNYTSIGGTEGPPFWYSGPSPPDENLIQNAVNTALALQTPT